MTVRIPLQLTGSPQAITDYFNENIDTIWPALDFKEVDRNDRITVENVNVDSVRIANDGKVELDYSYEWSFFSGCKDITDCGQVERSIVGRIVGGTLEFPEVLKTEPRSTLDEY